MWKHRIEITPSRKLVGIRLPMSLQADRTAELWRAFMPMRNEIPLRIGSDLLSVQIRREEFRPGDMHQPIEKWAASEVTEFAALPSGMERLILEGGMYAVFTDKGLSTDHRIFIYIFEEWLPNSAYCIDNRPHFEILGAQYKNNCPESEEEIWIPVRHKQVHPLAH